MENSKKQPFWPRFWYMVRPLAIAAGTVIGIGLFAGMLLGNQLCFKVLVAAILIFVVAMGCSILADRWKEYR